MRIIKILFCLSLLFVNLHFRGMQKPPAKASVNVPKPVVTSDIQDAEDENAWFSSLVNLVSKKVDPLGYATDNKAISYYNQALSYNPELPAPKKLNLDDTSKKVLNKITPRIIAARKQLLEAVESKDPDHKAIETLLELYRQVPQVFSECDCAILFGLHNWRRNAHKKSVHELSYYRPTEQATDQNQSVILDAHRSKQELVINAVELRKLAEQQYNWWNPAGIVAEGVHYLKKHYTHPIEHLTTVDSIKLCAGMAYFNPLNPLNNTDPDFTLKPDLEWHRKLVKKVVGREDIHLLNLVYSILHKRTANAMRLSKPVIATASSTVPPTIISPLTEALASGYLTFIQNSKIDNTPTDPQTLEAQRKQEEERKKAAEESAAKKKEQAEQEELKRQQALKEKETADAQRLEEEIQRRVTQQLAEKQQTEEKKQVEERERNRLKEEKAAAILKGIQEDKKRREDEERKAKEEAEAAFKAAEERAAKLRALAQSQDGSPSSSTTSAPTVVQGSPSAQPHQVYQADAVPKLEQNPEDICKCGSTKKYKNCCKKKATPSGSPQRPQQTQG